MEKQGEQKAPHNKFFGFFNIVFQINHRVRVSNDLSVALLGN